MDGIANNDDCQKFSTLLEKILDMDEPQRINWLAQLDMRIPQRADAMLAEVEPRLQKSLPAEPTAPCSCCDRRPGRQPINWKNLRAPITRALGLPENRIAPPLLSKSLKIKALF